MYVLVFCFAVQLLESELGLPWTKLDGGKAYSGMPGVNRVADFYEKSNMRPLEVVTACCGSNDPGDCFTLAPIKFLRKDANEATKQ